MYNKYIHAYIDIDSGSVDIDLKNNEEFGGFHLENPTINELEDLLEYLEKIYKIEPSVFFRKGVNNG